MNGPFSEFWHLNGQTFLTPMYMPIFSLGYQWVAAVCLAKNSAPVPGQARFQSVCFGRILYSNTANSRPKCHGFVPHRSSFCNIALQNFVKVFNSGLIYTTHLTHNILRKRIEGYSRSVPSLTFNTIKTKIIMHAFHSSRYLQSKWMLDFSHTSMVEVLYISKWCNPLYWKVTNVQKWLKPNFIVCIP